MSELREEGGCACKKNKHLLSRLQGNTQPCGGERGPGCDITAWAVFSCCGIFTWAQGRNPLRNQAAGIVAERGGSNLFSGALGVGKDLMKMTWPSSSPKRGFHSLAAVLTRQLPSLYSSYSEGCNVPDTERKWNSPRPLLGKESDPFWQ